MPIPDQVHINQVRDALWRRPSSRASVMVGAGFSQNAEKAKPRVGDMPSWQEITRQVCEKLYLPSDEKRLEDAIEEAAATSGFLKLAEEYKTAFGRSSLNQLVKRLVPDSDFRPGEMHKRILRLPWRDVFTTNWDTLLEKARPNATDRPYTVVRTVADIASTSSPRIVKLHGSFPSYYPLIFTEEDYRTYPREFAPFVNTVQQAMMETVFLLVGFSGDDPNFLHWSGWVRDNMQASAPLIYLAGWLDLSAHRRQVLIRRNVVPIDLAHHPRARSWPENLRHRYAVDWILRSLELGSPYDIADWPEPSSREEVAIKKVIVPVEVPTLDEPKIEHSTFSYGDENQTLAAVPANIDVWMHNRRLYPGWLSIPEAARNTFSRRTNEWERLVLKAIPSFDSSIERINTIRELMWRREILLDPISPALEEHARIVLDAIDCEARTVDGSQQPDANWEELREAWHSVALPLVTVARQRFDRVRFDRQIDAMSPFLDDHPDIVHTLRYERILWALYALDFEALLDLLGKWNTENCDPVWMMRKAAVLVECDRTEESVRLVRRALADIRKNSWDGTDLSAVSREGWALFMAEAFERHVGERPKSRYDRRMAELAVFHCDGREELRVLTERVNARPRDGEAPEFDHGMQTTQIVFPSSGNDGQIAARRAIRLTEVAALPPTANRVKIARDLLSVAVDELAQSEPRLASQCILRICRNDKDPLLRRVLSRTRVAVMSSASIEAVAQSCRDVIEYLLRRLSGETIERLRVAIEVLSRVVLRRSAEHAEEAFDIALRLYSNEVTASHLWLAGPIGNLMRRSWETLPVERKNVRVFDALLSPVVGLNGYIADESGHSLVDAGKLVWDELALPPRIAENEYRWTRLVALLMGLQEIGWIGGSAVDTGGVEIKTAEVKVDGVAEALAVTKAAR